MGQAFGRLAEAARTLPPPPPNSTAMLDLLRVLRAVQHAHARPLEELQRWVDKLHIPLYHRPHSPHQFVEKLIMVNGAFSPVLLAASPLFIYLYTGSIIRTLELFRTPTMNVSIFNGLIWLFYSQLLRKKETTADELVLSIGLVLVINFCYVLFVYGFRRSTWKGTFLSICVLASLLFLFVALRWNHILSESWLYVILGVGICTTIGCHIRQMLDIWLGCTGMMESTVTAVNILGPLTINASMLYWTWKLSPEEHFLLWFQSAVNSACCTIEIVMLFGRVAYDKFFKNVDNQNDDDDDDDERVNLIQADGDQSSAGSNEGDNSASESSESGSSFHSAKEEFDGNLAENEVTSPQGPSIPSQVSLAGSTESEIEIANPTSHLGLNQSSMSSLRVPDFSEKREEEESKGNRDRALKKLKENLQEGQSGARTQSPLNQRPLLTKSNEILQEGQKSTSGGTRTQSSRSQVPVVTRGAWCAPRRWWRGKPEPAVARTVS